MCPHVEEAINQARIPGENDYERLETPRPTGLHALAEAGFEHISHKDGDDVYVNRDEKLVSIDMSDHCPDHDKGRWCAQCWPKVLEAIRIADEAMKRMVCGNRQVDTEIFCTEAPGHPGNHRRSKDYEWGKWEPKTP
jgi:hypothetical protein